MRCSPETVSIGTMVHSKNAINDSPDYQRESGVWSLDRKQLFLDSLLNQLDIPKLYFEDHRAESGRYDFTVIDGKQRINAIWDFFDGKFPLADDFKLLKAPPGRKKRPEIKPGSRFRDLPDFWKDALRNTSLVVTMITGAEDDDIDELFSRLNNGEPLNAAEKRNARGGEMNKIIREVAALPFFRKKVGFTNKRFQHLEVAAKFLLIELTAKSRTGDPFCDMKKRFLDDMVENHRQIASAKRKSLLSAVEEGLGRLGRLFEDHDPLLSKQAYPPMYYLFAYVIDRDYGHKNMHSWMKSFLPKFQRRRLENLKLPEGEQDSRLIEFGRLMQQGTNDIGSLRERVSILKRSFLDQHRDIEIKDPKRLYSAEERYVIWIKSDKKCEGCGTNLRSIDEMEADHIRQHAHGGATTLANARALCSSCNSENR